MKSKVLLITLLSALLFIAGCRKQEAAQPGAAAAPTGPVTLSWALWDESTTPYYKAFADAYTARNPNVRIDFVDLGSQDYMTIAGVQLSGGADLDVITIKDIPGYSNLVTQNHLEPLNSYITSAGINTDQYGGLVDQLRVNGEVYTLPFRSDFWLIFYNKDIFDRAGVPYPSNDMTLDQYDALARRVTSGSGASKIYGAHYHTWRSTVQLFGILDGRNTIVDGTYDFLAPIYQRVLRQQDDGIVMTQASLKTSGTHYSGAFQNSQIAMMNMGSWYIATQINAVANGTATSRNWGLAKYPHPDGVPAGTTLGTITGISVNRNSTKKTQALDFIKFVSGPDGAAVLAATGNIPSIMTQQVIGSLSSIPGFPTDAGSREALNVYKTYLEMPLHARSGEIETVLNEADDAIRMYNMSVADGIRQMNDRVGQILRR